MAAVKMPIPATMKANRRRFELTASLLSEILGIEVRLLLHPDAL
jgi:hypothetical protein